MNVLLVYPQVPETFWSFKHVLRFVSRKAAFPPLGLLTVAALLPREWNLRLIDLNVEPLRDDDLARADYVMLSAMLVQKESARALFARCAALNKPVIAGGPLFTTGRESFPEARHVVLGESEEIMPQLVRDMSQGTLRDVYSAPRRPDLRQVPVPRWDLVRFQNYVTMAVQFSRGCPYDCEFCDIVAMNGRVPRTKTPVQVIAELDALRRLGWNQMVFIVDDNFIGDRRRTRALLHALIDWRARSNSSIGFLTEASVNLADDSELCSLMVRAGFKKVFVGIETPSLESLEECRKLQNRGRDLVQAVQTIQRSGMEVMGGFIIGFDHDPADICHRQFEFIQRSGVVTAMVGLLTALPQTRLYQRLHQEGRLMTESTGNNTAASLNFRTILNRDFLLAEYRKLMRRLYEPHAYYRRLRTFLAQYRPAGPGRRLSWMDTQAFLKSFWYLGVAHRGRLGFWWLLGTTLLRRPRHFRHAIELLIVGYHFRRVAGLL
jgi:radical SAM superfamily enzyme YgiQ (UPF0313 family)